MYRDWFAFEKSSQGITLCDPVLPAGKVYEDDLLGEQVIYR